MATIKHKRGTSDPSTSDVAVGELAINTTDGGVFTQTDGGSVVEVGGGGGLSSDSDNNTIGGTNAGDTITSGQGTNNTLIGYNAGTDLTTADGVTAFGSEAGANVTSGYGTTAVGYEACKATKDSYANTGIGHQALKAADNAGGEYTFLGAWNTAVGTNSLDSLTTGRANTCMGVRSGDNMTTGYDNVAVGYEALKQGTGCTENTAIGSDAGKSITGSGNTLIGRRAAFVQSLSGSNNILIGKLSQASSTSVSNECTIGATGQYGGQITKFRIPGCNFSLKSTTATEDYVLTVDSNGDCGWEAAAGGGITVQEEGSSLSTDATTLNFTGAYATATGSGATKTISVYAHSIGALTRGGTDAGSDGAGSTFFGYGAGQNAASGAGGDRNTAFGAYAFKLGSNNSNGNNVAVGWYALYTASSSSNTAVGTGACQNLTSGGSNATFGQSAGKFLTTGGSNTFIGTNAGQDVTTGFDNVALGHNAGNSGTNDITTGSNNILIGHDATASSATVSNEITLGDANITKFRVPGINVVLKDNGGTPTNGHVLTVDANGEAGFAAAAGGGGPTGGGSDEIFTENDQTMTTDYTITNNKNAMAAGPITINNGVTLTIGAGETVTIV